MTPKESMAHCRYALAAMLPSGPKSRLPMDPEHVLPLEEEAVRRLGAERAAALMELLARAARTKAGMMGASELLWQGAWQRAGWMEEAAGLLGDEHNFVARAFRLGPEKSAKLLDPWPGAATGRVAKSLVPGRLQCSRCGSGSIVSKPRPAGRGDEGEAVDFTCANPEYHPPGCGHRW
jgi:hypothetical protein